jgi:hypothetical protein
MAVKKSSAAKTAAKNETVESKPTNIELERQDDETNDAGVPETENVRETASFCVYIGPSIRGVIQSGTIYSGSLEETLKFLSPAIEKYPLIAKLISTDKTIAEDRVKVKTAGNLLNVYYKKLATGRKE